MSEWLDISSAPRNGDRVIARGERRISVVYWDGRDWQAEVDIHDANEYGAKHYEWTPREWLENITIR